MRLSWHDLGTKRADQANGREVEFIVWPTTALPVKTADYFLLTSEPNCCAGCVPGNRLAVIEVFAKAPIDFTDHALRLGGSWHVVTDDPSGWRYQLRGAYAIGGLKRRRLLAASSLVCLPIPALAQAGDGMAIDLHSHAGNLNQMSFGRGQFSPVAEPMRQGGVSAICLAVVADAPTITTKDGRLRPCRDPRPGELYAFSQRSFGALHALAKDQELPLIKTAADLRAARA